MIILLYLHQVLDNSVGTGKTVTISSSYSGSDVSNYSVTNQASTTANITAKALTVSGITASDKVMMVLQLQLWEHQVFYIRFN